MIKQMTKNEFIKEYRPDGLGHIGFQTLNEKGEPENIWEETFEEIMCDKCNADIIQPTNEDGKVDEDKKTIFLDTKFDTVMCWDCYDQRYVRYNKYNEVVECSIHKKEYWNKRGTFTEEEKIKNHKTSIRKYYDKEKISQKAHKRYIENKKSRNTGGITQSA